MVCVTLLFGIENHPKVSQSKALSYENIKKAKQILKDNRLKQFSQRKIKTLSLTETESNLLVSYAISQGLDINDLFVEVKFSDDTFRFILTKKLSFLTSDRYMNIQLTLLPEDNLLKLDACQIGRLRIPGGFIQPVMSVLHYLFLKIEFYENLWQNVHAIKKVTIKQKRMTCYYKLDHAMIKDLQEKSRSFLIPDLQQLKLIEYHNHLSQLTVNNVNRKNAVLNLLKEMFAFARDNSKTNDDPVLENKTALQVLSLYVTHQRLDRFLNPEYRGVIKQPAKTKLMFQNRTDLPKHFLVSAAITVSAGSKFARLVGIAKEIDDSDGGSGFSFADLAADKAGVLFGELATASSQKAAAFQEKIRLIRSEAELFPSISDLPEGIMELEFKRRYKDLDSDAYQLIHTEIEKRLNRCRLYRG